MSYRTPTRYEVYEQQVLRQEEADKETFNAVADAAIYFLISEPQITNAVRMKVYTEVIPRFADRLPAQIVRALVDATIRQETELRAKVALARKGKPAAARL
jgi:hypothetical protein